MRLSHIFTGLSVASFIAMVALGGYLFSHRPSTPSVDQGYILKLEESNHGKPSTVYVTRLEYGVFGLSKGLVFVFFPVTGVIYLIERLSMRKA